MGPGNQRQHKGPACLVTRAQASAARASHLPRTGRRGNLATERKPAVNINTLIGIVALIILILLAIYVAEKV